MIGIVNYGSGNIQAIVNIYNRLNIQTKIKTAIHTHSAIKHQQVTSIESISFITTIKGLNNVS